MTKYSYKGIIFTMGPIHMTSFIPNHLAKTPFPSNITLGVKASAYKSGMGTQTFKFIIK
jgi:hypothetical protein